MKDISIKGLVVAAVVALALDFAWSAALLFHISGATADEAAVAAAMETLLQDDTYLAISLVLGLLTTLLGGYIVARIARTAKVFNAMLFGCIGIVLNVFTAADLPLWFNLLNFLLLIPAAVFGAALSIPKVRTA
jgi:hypothetical protein